MTITMPRGDIRDVQFTVYAANGTVTEYDFTEIFFTVKEKASDAAALFQKSLTGGTITKESTGVYSFSIMPEDTDDLNIGRYVFDIELIVGTTVKQTTLGDLILSPEVTHAGNEEDE